MDIVHEDTRAPLETGRTLFDEAEELELKCADVVQIARAAAASASSRSTSGADGALDRRREVERVPAR